MTAKPFRKRSFVKDNPPTNAGLLLGYARVSKGDEQNNALQTKALKADTTTPAERMMMQMVGRLRRVRTGDDP